MKKLLLAILSMALACGIGVAATGCGGSKTAISVYNREDGSGTRSAFIEILGIEKTELIDGVSQFSSTGQVLTAVAGDKNGIGYISLGSLDDTVKALTIDGVTPSVEAVAGGSYKVARPFELMYQQEKYEASDLFRDFITFLKSKQAQAVLQAYGYVSVYPTAADYVAPETPFSDTTLTINGSTSVQPLMATDDDDKVSLITAYKEACGQNVEITVAGGGSGVGIKDAAAGKVDIGMASKEVAQSDFENPTGTMVIYKLCSDGIAVIVHKNNAVSALKTSDLVDIYTGKVKDWSEYSA